MEVLAAWRCASEEIVESLCERCRPVPCHPALSGGTAGTGEDRRVLSKSAQYRRLLKMHGAGQQASLTAGAQGAQGGSAGAAGAGQPGGSVANDGCQMCEFVVQYIKIALANNETMAQVGGRHLSGLLGALWGCCSSTSH